MALLLFASVPIYILRNPLGFRIACVAGPVIAGLFWWLCSLYTRMWNRAFRMRLVHHFLCGLAALCTVLVCILFASVQETGDVVDQAVQVWRDQTKEIASWAQAGSDAMDARTAVSVADLARQFEASQPYLSSVLQLSATSLPMTGGSNSAPRRETAALVDEAAGEIEHALTDHIYSLIFRMRFVLIFVFLVAQAIPFALTGWHANEDIRPRY